MPDPPLEGGSLGLERWWGFVVEGSIDDFDSGGGPVSARLKGVLALITAGGVKLKSSGPEGVRAGKPVLGLTEVGVISAVVQSSQGRFTRRFPVNRGGEGSVHAGDGRETDAPSKTPDNYGLHSQVEDEGAVFRRFGSEVGPGLADRRGE